MTHRTTVAHSTWYVPGNWALPEWWTGDLPSRGGCRGTRDEWQTFLKGDFCRKVLGHTGGMTSTPTTTPLDLSSWD